MSSLLLSAALFAPPCSAIAVDAVVTVRVSRPLPRPVGPFGERGEETLAEESGVLLSGPTGSPVVLTTFRAAAFAPTAVEARDARRASGDVRAVLRLADGRSLPVAVLAADPHSGLATLVPIEPAPALPTVELAEDVGPAVGEAVCTLHRRPGDVTAAATSRTIAALGRSFPAAAAGGGREWAADDPGPGVLHAFDTLAELEPPPPPGSSGGGVFDRSGALVGLLLEPTAGDPLRPRMLPLTGSFRRVVHALLAGEMVAYGLLGVEPGTITPDAAFAGLGEGAPPGAAALEDVRGNSPAERAGLRRGEWVVGMIGPDGTRSPVRSAADLVRLVALARPSSTVALEVLAPRTGERRTATVALAAAATGRAAGGWPAVAKLPRGEAVRGVRVDWPTAAALTPPGEPLPTGALIVHVEPTTNPSGDAGVRRARVGDRVVTVEGRPIASPAEFVAAVTEAPGPLSVRLADGATAVLP